MGEIASSLGELPLLLGELQDDARALPVLPANVEKAGVWCNLNRYHGRLQGGYVGGQPLTQTKIEQTNVFRWEPNPGAAGWWTVAEKGGGGDALTCPTDTRSQKPAVYASTSTDTCASQDSSRQRSVTNKSDERLATSA